MTRGALLLALVLASQPALAQIPALRRARGAQPSRAGLSLKRRVGVSVAESLIDSQEPSDRQRGFERLGGIGTAQALDLLLRAFDTDGSARSAKDRLVAVRALAPHAAVPAVRDFLVRIMVGVGSSPERPEAIDRMIEQAAALALAATGDDNALAALGKTLRQPGHVADTAQDALLAFPPRNLQPIVRDLRAPTRALAGLLGDLGDLRAIPALRELVRSAPMEVRPTAAVALSKLGVRDTIELGRHWLEYENGPDFQLAATRILLQFETPDAGAALSRLLSNEHNRAAALELLNTARLASVSGALIEQARAAAPDERSALFAAVGLSGTRAGFDFLAVALSARDTASAAALALALSPDNQADSVLERALRARPTRRAALRACLVRKLALERTVAGFDSALRALSESADESDQALAFQAQALGSPKRVPELLKRASVWQIRALARAALIPEVAAALSDRLATERDPARREALAAGLVSDEAAERVPSNVLLGLIDARGLAAPLAARALGLRDSRALRPKILSLLASSDALIRSHAALGLGKSEDGSALGVLTQAYRFETDAAVRLAIVQALSARPEPARRRALELARTLDGSRAVREAAALGLTGAQLDAGSRGPQSAWLDLSVGRDAGLGASPVLSALVIISSGLALPAFADPDGVLLLSALPTGPVELRLAAPTRTDDAVRTRQP